MTPDELEFLCSYEEVRGLLVYSVRKFQGRYGGDRAELLDTAVLAFCKAYRDWDAEKGDGQGFAVWASYKAWHAMLDALKAKMRCREEAWPEGLEVSSEDGFDYFRFLASLSEDARLLVQIVCGQDKELKLALLVNGRAATSSHRASVREALWRVLREAGWPRARVRAAFKEIQEALE